VIVATALFDATHAGEELEAGQSITPSGVDAKIVFEQAT
jgi:hypothetical protein